MGIMNLKEIMATEDPAARRTALLKDWKPVPIISADDEFYMNEALANQAAIDAENTQA